MHASNMSNSKKERPFDGLGPIAAAEGEKAHDVATRAGLMKCSAAIAFAGAPFADLERWELGATGTRGES